MTTTRLHIEHDLGVADVAVEGRYGADELVEELVGCLGLPPGPWRLTSGNMSPTDTTTDRWLEGSTVQLTRRPGSPRPVEEAGPRIIGLDRDRGWSQPLRDVDTVLGCGPGVDICVVGAAPRHCVVTVSSARARPRPGEPTVVVSCRPLDGPITVNGEIVERCAALRPGDVLEIAGTSWTVATSDADHCGSSTIGIRRPPRIEFDDPRRELDVPALPEPPGRLPAPWVTLVVTLGMALALLGRVDGSMAIIYAITPLLIVAGWLETVWSRRRDSRHRERVDIALIDEVSDSVSSSVAAWQRWDRWARPPLDDLIDQVGVLGVRLWERSGGDADRLVVRIGHTSEQGPLSQECEAVLATPSALLTPGQMTALRRRRDVADAYRLDRAALTVDLAAGPVGIAGPAAAVDAIARALVIQLAVLRSPDELEIAHPPNDWKWARWLPHATPVGAGSPRISSKAETLRVVDSRNMTTAHARTVADSVAGQPVIWLASDEAAIPRHVSHVVNIAPDATHVVLRSGRRHTIGAFEGISRRDAERVARRLAPCRSATNGDAPESLWEHLDARPIGLEIAWFLRRHNPLAVDLPIACGDNGIRPVNLVTEGPHALLAGTTGSGKSVLLVSLVLAAAVRTHPRDLQLILVDFKGGATFGPLVDLPHTVGTITNLDDCSLSRIHAGIDAEIDRRMALLAATGSVDIAEHNRIVGVDDPRRLASLLIVVDEFASLVVDHPATLDTLTSAAQRGRSLGVHVILATQRPTGVVTPAIAANTALRICLRTLDPADALDVVGSPQPSTFDPARPGTALIGRDLVTVLSTTARSDSRRVVPLDEWPPPPTPTIDGVERAVRAIRRTWIRDCERAGGDTRPPAPWGPPLPDTVPFDGRGGEDGSVVVALIDRPTEPSPEPLHWRRSHVAVIGGEVERRSVLDAVAAAEPMSVIIGRGVTDRPAPCVEPTDAEWLLRLRVVPPAVLVLDDIAELADIWDDTRRSDWWSWLTASVRSGTVHAVIGARSDSEIPLGWRDLFASTYRVEPGTRGRCRDDSGRLVQFAHVTARDFAVAADRRETPWWQRRLPRTVEATADETGWRVGVDDTTLENWTWDGLAPLVVVAERHREALALARELSSLRPATVFDLDDLDATALDSTPLDSTAVVIAGDIDAASGYSSVIRRLRRTANWLVIPATIVEDVGLPRTRESARADVDRSMAAFMDTRGLLHLGRAARAPTSEDTPTSTNTTTART